MTRRGALTGMAAGMTALAAGCVRIPNTYAPPIERKPVTGFSSNGFGSIVNMNDAAAPAHILKDVGQSVEGGAWRWAGKRPELRFAVSTTAGVRAVVDFTIPKVAFDQTGPVTLSFFVNGNLLDTMRCAEPGQKHFEKNVPPEWLRTNATTKLAAEIDKMYTPQPRGAEFGFILSRAGFLE